MDHIFQWKEIPDQCGKPLTVKNYDETMLASGKAGESLELRLAGAKGQANAIAARLKKTRMPEKLPDGFGSRKARM